MKLPKTRKVWTLSTHKLQFYKTFASLDVRFDSKWPQMTWKVFITEASKIEPLSTPKASQSAPAVERNLDFSHAQYLTQFHAGKDCLPFEIILDILQSIRKARANRDDSCRNKTRLPKWALNHWESLCCSRMRVRINSLSDDRLKLSAGFRKVFRHVGSTITHASTSQFMLLAYLHKQPVVKAGYKPTLSRHRDLRATLENFSPNFDAQMKNNLSSCSLLE